jgi:stage II sporulation protein AA (anti-sigma F factor antagonist)
MTISTKINGDVAIINLQGPLDFTSSNQLKEASREFFSRDNCKLVLNMERVDFINSPGLGALVSILKEVRNHNGELKISNLAEYIKEIFDITQLSSIFEICEDETHALKSF